MLRPGGAPAAGPVGVVPLVGEFDLYLAAVLGGDGTHLFDGGHRGAGDHRDQGRPGLERHRGEQLARLGDPDVSQDLLVGEQRPDLAHGPQALGQDQHGAALDDVDARRRLLQRSQGAGQIGLVQRDLKSGSRHRGALPSVTGDPPAGPESKYMKPPIHRTLRRGPE